MVAQRAKYGAMKCAAILLSLTLTVSTTAEATADEDRTLPFACGDVVVVGTVHNRKIDAIEDQGDALGHGLASATIRVRRVIRGPKLPSLIPANYLAHAYLRENQEFMLVLSKGDHGRFSIETGQLMSAHPRLAARCE